MAPTQNSDATRTGSGGGEDGLPEPKSREDWAVRGGTGGEAGRGLSVPGGASQGTGDRSGTSGADAKDVDNPVGRPPQPKPGQG